MDSNILSANESDKDIDLLQVFGALWAGKFIIIAITTVFAIGSVFYALSIPNQYKASALLAPVQEDGGGLTNYLGQLGGFASLAGMQIGGSQITESKVAQEIMQSWSFIESFVRDNDLAFEVYAAEGWNKASGQLIYSPELYDSENRDWLSGAAAPTGWQLFKRFSDIVSVSQDLKSGFISVSIEFYSPDIAKKWLDMYLSAINIHMQKRQISKVTNNITFLEEQIKKTSITEMREVFYTIIEEQIKKKMVAEASPNYAFVAIAPSMVPQQKSTPRRAFICIVGTLFGGLFSVILVLVMHYIRHFGVNK